MDKRRRRPLPDAVILKPLAFNLEEALQVESLFRPNLLIVNESGCKPGEVTFNSRDGAVNVLRFLRVWLDLPHTAYFFCCFIPGHVPCENEGAREIPKMSNPKLSSFGKQE